MTRLTATLLLALLLPGLAFAAIEIWYQATHPANESDGAFAWIFLLYFVGFAVWSALRLALSRGALLLAAGVLFVLGLPFTAAVSLGIYALAGPLIAIGGAVATMALGPKRYQPALGG